MPKSLVLFMNVLFSIRQQLKITSFKTLLCVLGKRKISLDQILKGLKNLGVLNHLRAYPNLYRPLFVVQKCIRAEDIINVLQFELGDKLQMKDMFCRFISSTSTETLQKFLCYCTGATSLPLFSNIKVKVENCDGLFGHTCANTIVIPSFEEYDSFERAMSAVLSNKHRQKSFTSV